MKILNKSKRTIDGITPLKTVDVKPEQAERLRSLYGSEIEIIGEGSDASDLITEQKNLKAQIVKLQKELKESQEIAEEYAKDNAKMVTEHDKLFVEFQKLQAENEELKKVVPVPPAPPASKKQK